MATGEKLALFEPPKPFKTYRMTESSRGHQERPQKTPEKSRNQKVVKEKYASARTTPALQYEFAPDPYGQDSQGHQ